MVAAGPENPPRNQVVPVVRPPSGAISARPCHGLSGAPYTCSGGPSELGGWVHGCWGQHHRRAHPSNAFCPPPCHPSSGSYQWYDPPCVFRHLMWLARIVVYLLVGAVEGWCGWRGYANPCAVTLCYVTMLVLGFGLLASVGCHFFAFLARCASKYIKMPYPHYDVDLQHHAIADSHATAFD